MRAAMVKASPEGAKIAAAKHKECSGEPTWQVSGACVAISRIYGGRIEQVVPSLAQFMSESIGRMDAEVERHQKGVDLVALSTWINAAEEQREYARTIVIPVARHVLSDSKTPYGDTMIRAIDGLVSLTTDEAASLRRTHEAALASGR